MDVQYEMGRFEKYSQCVLEIAKEEHQEESCLQWIEDSKKRILNGESASVIFSEELHKITEELKRRSVLN